MVRADPATCGRLPDFQISRTDVYLDRTPISPIRIFDPFQGTESVDSGGCGHFPPSRASTRCVEIEDVLVAMRGSNRRAVPSAFTQDVAFIVGAHPMPFPSDVGRRQQKDIDMTSCTGCATVGTSYGNDSVEILLSFDCRYAVKASLGDLDELTLRCIMLLLPEADLLRCGLRAELFCLMHGDLTARLSYGLYDEGALNTGLGVSFCAFLQAGGTQLIKGLGLELKLQLPIYLPPIRRLPRVLTLG